MDIPEDIMNHICCLAIKMRDPHPFAVEIKSLKMIDGIIEKYIEKFGDDAMDWLILDLDVFYPTNDFGWGVHRKWRFFTPNQRREFCDWIDENN